MKVLNTLQKQFRLFNSERFVLLLMAVMAFMYITIRAYCIPITHDEAFSFYLMDINYLQALGTTANTHWLNTFCMKLPNLLGLNQPFALRWHSIAAFGVYVFFIFKIGRFFKTQAAVWMMGTLFLINHFTLEYFSLARGYGLTLALFMGAIYFALKIIHANKIVFNDYVGALLLGTLAVAANYATLFPFIGLMIYLLIMAYQKEGEIHFLFKRKWTIYLGLIGFTCLLAIINLLLIKNISNDLHYGGEQSFLKDTLSSMWANIFQVPKKTPSSLAWNPTLHFLSGFLLAAIGAITFLGILKKEKNVQLFTFLFTFIYLFNNLLFYVMDIPFPLGRTALVLFPIIAFGFIFLVDRELLKINWRIRRAIAYTLLVFMGVTFFKSANFNRAYVWEHQSVSQVILEEILTDEKAKEEEEEEENQAKSIKIISDNTIYPVWKNYYAHIAPQKYAPEGLMVNYLQRPIDTLQFKQQVWSNNYLIVEERSYGPILKNMTSLKLMQHYPKAKVLVFGVPQNPWNID